MSSWCCTFSVVFVCAVQDISHSCHVELLSATTSTAVQTKPQIHDLLRLHQTTKFSLFFSTRAFHFLWELLSRRCRKLIFRDFLTILVGVLVVHFKEVAKWQKISPKKTRNEKRKVDPNTFVQRSQLKALRRNVDNEWQVAKKQRVKLKWESWSYGSDWKAWMRCREGEKSECV